MVTCVGRVWRSATQCCCSRIEASRDRLQAVLVLVLRTAVLVGLDHLDLKSIQQHLATKFRDSRFYLQNFDCGGPGTTSHYLNRCSLPYSLFSPKIRIFRADRCSGNCNFVFKTRLFYDVPLQKSRDLEIGVRGHSRLLEAAQFDRLCMVSY